MAEVKTMRPYDVTDVADFLGLQSDNHPSKSGVWSILHGGDSVSLHAPDGSGWVTIPIDEFRVIVDWFISPQAVGRSVLEQDKSDG